MNERIAIRILVVWLTLTMLTPLLGCRVGVFAGGGSGGVGGGVGVEQDVLPSPGRSEAEAGRLLIEKGEYEVAAASLERTHAENPKDWRAQYYLGLAYIGLDRRDEGFELVKTIVIPFAYYMKREIVCTAEYVEEKDMPGPEAIKAMLDYLAVSEQRQRVRDRPLRGNPDLEYKCPPFLYPAF
ncbi:hypothetical protein dsat_0971 [Alkalidesulfovibrio alkalitolerans DSM 16529]|uniref:Tetratricopeptide repeat protein n=1 Tax=Alkalidesulfovibrio alkalitolerans DSM 16529 TaxID=1121439 RepID=S7T2T8_9BACT|nr:tetratricopeptide repeat protein [Alkalidesulfovibrio alkalitolerans]EPR31382.1 hypothetical protein dsat_0971 [Alkalidesulfovibrio alkalitolerans DSM 16529]